MNRRNFLAAVAATAVVPAASALRRGNKIWYTSPLGDDSNAGTYVSPFRSIQRGLKAVEPGDQLFVKAGDYKERDFVVAFTRSRDVRTEPKFKVARAE